MLYSLSGMTLEERKACKVRSIKFPMQLMYVLECGDFDEIVSWTYCGQAFEVHDPMAFEHNILPQIFNKKSKFSSFQRKLLRWAFDRKKKSFIYTHPKFKRGDWDACKSMTMLTDNVKDRKLIRQSLRHAHHQSGGDNSTFSQNSREQYLPPSQGTSSFGGKIQRTDSFSTLATQSTKDTSFYSRNSCLSSSSSQRSDPEDETVSSSSSNTRMMQHPLQRRSNSSDADLLEEQIEHMKVKLQHLRQAFSRPPVGEHFGVSPCLIGGHSDCKNPILIADQIMREAYEVLEN